jgi:hypothetical protein
MRQHVPRTGCVIGVSAADRQTCIAKGVGRKIGHKKNLLTADQVTIDAEWVARFFATVFFSPWGIEGIMD